MDKVLQAVREARDIQWEDHGKCFGFCRCVLAKLGIEIPDYTFGSTVEGAALFYEHFHDHVSPIEKDLAKPGDIVAAIYRNLFHLGIYLGGNRMAHWRERELGIVLERIDQPPYSRHAIEFYRVIQHA